MEINLQQSKAATVSSKNALILAGPGTDKTTTLLARCEYLISKGIQAQSILCCSFVRKMNLFYGSALPKTLTLDNSLKPKVEGNTEKIDDWPD